MTFPKILIDLSDSSRRRSAEIDSLPSGYEYLRLQYSRLVGLLRTKVHQCRSLLRNRDLIRAVLAEGSSGDSIPGLDVGDVLRIFGDDGRCVRLAIRGFRTNSLFTTYFAIDLGDLMPCCLKVCRESEPIYHSLEQIWRREAGLSLRLPPHPNLVKTLEAFSHRRKLYLRTEYFPATPLDRMVENGPLCLKDAMIYAVHLCRALVAVQAVFPGYVHGNINPGCCLISRDGTLELSDLGHGSTNRIGVRAFSPTKGAGDVRLSPENYLSRIPLGVYTAPEFRDDAPRSISGDVYSFGMMLVEMLCGRRHFTSLLNEEMILNQATSLNSSGILSDRGIFPELRDLVQRCLSSSPDRRPTDFSVLAHQLEVMFEEQFPGSIAVRTIPKLTETEIGGRAISLSRFGSSGVASDYLDSAAWRT